MQKQRKHYTPEEKVAILRRHLLDGEPGDESRRARLQVLEPNGTPLFTTLLQMPLGELYLDGEAVRRP
jgi:hypothetical protein